MTVLNPSKKLPLKRPGWIALIGAASLVLTALLYGAAHLARQAREVAPAVTMPAIQQAVAKLTTPKVGDLTITQEAMELAEIKLAPAGRRLVSEKLVVGGTIEAGGDRLV